MKNTSILIPIVLIGCLAALGFLFFRAFQTVDDDRLRTNRQIILDEADYAEDPAPTDLGTRTDYDDPAATPAYEETTAGRPLNAEAVRTEAGDGFDELTPAQRAVARREFEARQRRAEEETADLLADPEENIVYPEEEPTQTAPPVSEPAGTGRYLVIAGSFRQRINAQERVRNLRRAGFEDTRLEPFNRGTYAVALAGQSDSFTAANQLAQRIKAAGFEVEVLRRR